MPHEKLNPAQHGAARALDRFSCLAAENASEFSNPLSDIQAHRVAWLTRRAKISAIHADVIAALAFGTGSAR